MKKLLLVVVIGLFLGVPVLAQEASETQVNLELIWSGSTTVRDQVIHLGDRFPLPATTIVVKQPIDGGHRFLLLLDPFGHQPLIKGQLELRDRDTTWTLGQQAPPFGAALAQYPYVFDTTSRPPLYADVPLRNPGISVAQKVGDELTFKAGIFADALAIGGPKYTGGGYGVARLEWQPAGGVTLGASQRLSREPATGADLTVRLDALELKAEWVDSKLGSRHFEQLRLPVTRHADGAWQDSLALRVDNLPTSSELILGWRHDFSKEEILLLDYNTKTGATTLQFRLKI
ncbi:hypothetical protein HY375_00355 [Candidatus Berkelbacteria bacterium]|nr:hypothetical protein [Candidatus Berkelbacteria bacterium]